MTTAVQEEGLRHVAPEHPASVPDGYVSQAELKFRGWPPRLICKALREFAIHDGSADPNRSPFWYPDAEARRVEGEHAALATRIAETVPRRPGGYAVTECVRLVDLLDSGWSLALVHRILGREPDREGGFANYADPIWYAAERVAAAEATHSELTAEKRETRAEARREAAWARREAEEGQFRAMREARSVPVTVHAGEYCLVLPAAGDDMAHCGQWVRADHPQSSGVWIAQPFQRVATRADGDVYSMFVWSGPHWPDDRE